MSWKPNYCEAGQEIPAASRAGPEHTSQRTAAEAEVTFPFFSVHTSGGKAQALDQAQVSYGPCRISVWCTARFFN